MARIELVPLDGIEQNGLMVDDSYYCMECGEQLDWGGELPQYIVDDGSYYSNYLHESCVDTYKDFAGLPVDWEPDGFEFMDDIPPFGNEYDLQDDP